MAFDFDSFIRNMNSKIDSFQKKKEEKERLEFDTQKAYNDRMLSEQERNNGAQRQLGFQQLELQKKKYQDASDNEYYRRKHVYDVQAGNMNPDTYAALYGGMAAGADGGNLRGKKGGRGGSDGAEPDYANMILEAYKARDTMTDQRDFDTFADDMLNGKLDRATQKRNGGLRDLFQQQQSAGQAYNDRKTMKDSLFNQNVSMTRDPNGKMRFGIGQENADATGWDNVKGNVQKNRLNNPRIAPNSNMQGFTPPAIQSLGQVSNDIYQGARRSMMSPAYGAVNNNNTPTPQSARVNGKQPSYWLDEDKYHQGANYGDGSDFEGFKNPLRAIGQGISNVVDRYKKNAVNNDQNSSGVMQSNNQAQNNLRTPMSNPVPPMPDGYEGLRKALSKAKSKKPYSRWDSRHK